MQALRSSSKIASSVFGTRTLFTRSAMSPSFPVKIAVLDDYQGFSEPKYGALDPAKYEVSFFRDTLRPYNHPDTTQDEKDKLVKRLEPFTVICEYCNVFFL